MEFPSALRYALEQRLSELQTSALTAQAQALSERYRTQTGTGRKLLTEDIQAAAYAAVRMLEQLAATGMLPNAKCYTPIQVHVIVEAWGEP